MGLLSEAQSAQPKDPETLNPFLTKTLTRRPRRTK
jgi:hypothetical protein